MTHDHDAEPLDHRAPGGGGFGTNGTFYLGGQFMHRTGGTYYGPQASARAKAELTAQVAPQVPGALLAWVAEAVPGDDAGTVFLAAWALYVDRVVNLSPSKPERITAGAVAKRAAMPLPAAQAALDALVAAGFVLSWERKGVPYFLADFYGWSDADVMAARQED